VKTRNNLNINETCLTRRDWRSRVWPPLNFWGIRKRAEVDFSDTSNSQKQLVEVAATSVAERLPELAAVIALPCYALGLVPRTSFPASRVACRAQRLGTHVTATGDTSQLPFNDKEVCDMHAFHRRNLPVVVMVLQGALQSSTVVAQVSSEAWRVKRRAELTDPDRLFTRGRPRIFRDEHLDRQDSNL
jgi:hypothetical protein